jgi:uncharacterized protein (TIGR03435 family)
MADRSDLRARIAAVLDGSQSRGRAGTLQAAVILGGAVVLVLGISPLHAVASRTSSIDLTPRLRFAPRLRAQAAQAPVAAGNTPMFEAASIKRNKSGDGRMQLGGPPGRFTATNVPVRNLIQNAYRLQPFQLVGAPGWIGTDRFDIVAKADGTLDPPPFAADQQTGPSRLQLMLRALLAERFKLMAHTETRELPVYALTLARSDGRLGGQLRRSTTDCATLALTRRGGPGGAPGPGGTGALAKGGPDGRGIGLGPGPMPAQGERPPCGVRVGPGSIMAGGVSASQLARELSSWLNQIVVDRTGLTGTFDVDLTWTPDQFSQGRGELPSGSVAIDPSGPSIYTAVQEQLGLKLESQQGSVDVLVIDHVEQPTED